jgi:DNA-binding IclR family transcriptional regulator
LSLQGQHAFDALAEAHLGPWSRRMNGNALLLLRSGYEYVCSVRAGPAPLPGLMVDRGTRRPLFTSVGGVAILQALPEEERRDVMENNTAQEIARRGTARLAQLERVRERSGRHGFGVNLGDVVTGVHAFAVPLHGPDSKVFAALCLMGTAEQFPEARIEDLRKELLAEAAVLEAQAAKLLFSPGTAD